MPKILQNTMLTCIFIISNQWHTYNKIHTIHWYIHRCMQFIQTFCTFHIDLYIPCLCCLKYVHGHVRSKKAYVFKVVMELNDITIVILVFFFFYKVHMPFPLKSLYCLRFLLLFFYVVVSKNSPGFDSKNSPGLSIIIFFPFCCHYWYDYFFCFVNKYLKGWSGLEIRLW